MWSHECSNEYPGHRDRIVAEEDNVGKLSAPISADQSNGTRLKA